MLYLPNDIIQFSKQYLPNYYQFLTMNGGNHLSRTCRTLWITICLFLYWAVLIESVPTSSRLSYGRHHAWRTEYHHPLRHRYAYLKGNNNNNPDFDESVKVRGRISRQRPPYQLYDPRPFATSNYRRHIIARQSCPCGLMREFDSSHVSTNSWCAVLLCQRLGVIW